MKHIAKIMTGFTARFGAQELKDGQSAESIKRSWERALGQYAEEDLVKVATNWADTAKYPRWPEVGEILERIKEWGIKPVQLSGDRRPQNVIEAERQAGHWYRWLIGQPNLAIGLTNSFILTSILQDVYGQSDSKVPQTFTFMLTRAFMHDMLPAQWEERRDAFMVTYLANKEAYKLACDKYGMARINESKGEWQKWS